MAFIRKWIAIRWTRANGKIQLCEFPNGFINAAANVHMTPAFNRIGILNGIWAIVAHFSISESILETFLFIQNGISESRGKWFNTLWRLLSIPDEHLASKLVLCIGHSLFRRFSEKVYFVLMIRRTVRKSHPTKSNQIAEKKKKYHWINHDIWQAQRVRVKAQHQNRCFVEKAVDLKCLWQTTINVDNTRFE